MGLVTSSQFKNFVTILSVHTKGNRSFKRKCAERTPVKSLAKSPRIFLKLSLDKFLKKSLIDIRRIFTEIVIKI